MNILQSFIITLSMYTAIPVPMTEWNEKNLRHCLAFLPVPGAAAALAQFLFFLLSVKLEISPALYAAGFCAIPILITGGIHLDGLIDTCDALGSRGSREKKLMILDDPHTGAFGVTGAILYFLALYGIGSELYIRLAACAPVSTILKSFSGSAGMSALSPALTAAVVFFVPFVLSRTMTALHIVSLPPSKEKGLLYTFSSVSSKKSVMISAAAALSVCIAAVFSVFTWKGILPAAGVLFFSLYFRRMVKKEFGGISGDLCGWHIQMQELILMICFAVALIV